MGQTVVEEAQPPNAVKEEMMRSNPQSTHRTPSSPLPGFRDLVLRWQEGVVDSCRGGVTKRRQTQELDLRQAQGAGVSRPVQPQAHSRRHLRLHQLDLDVCEAAGDDGCGQGQHVDPICADLHRHRRRTRW